MKVVKTSAIALAISAMVAGPVLAQGTSSDTKIRGGVQGKSQMQGGASSSEDEELNAQSVPGAVRPRALAAQPAMPRLEASATDTALSAGSLRQVRNSGRASTG